MAAAGAVRLFRDCDGAAACPRPGPEFRRDHYKSGEKDAAKQGVPVPPELR